MPSVAPTVPRPGKLTPGRAGRSQWEHGWTDRRDDGRTPRRPDAVGPAVRCFARSQWPSRIADWSIFFIRDRARGPRSIALVRRVGGYPAGTRPSWVRLQQPGSPWKNFSVLGGWF